MLAISLLAKQYLISVNVLYPGFGEPAWSHNYGVQNRLSFVFNGKSGKGKTHPKSISYSIYYTKLLKNVP